MQVSGAVGAGVVSGGGTDWALPSPKPTKRSKIVRRRAKQHWQDLDALRKGVEAKDASARMARAELAELRRQRQQLLAEGGG